jgi:DNA polymerase sigma
MVLHFLQHKKILPILPLKNAENSEKPEYVYNTQFTSPSSSPSIAELLIEFFEYFLKFDYVNKAITLRTEEGILPKSTTAIASQTKTPMVFVLEDPFIVIENTARTISNHSLHDIRQVDKRKFCNRHCRVELNRAYQTLTSTKNVAELCAPVKNKRKERSPFELPPLEYMNYK